jgi:hypothetical protein
MDTPSSRSITADGRHFSDVIDVMARRDANINLDQGLKKRNVTERNGTERNGINGIFSETERNGKKRNEIQKKRNETKK